MFLKRNVLETVTLISCSGTVICILLAYLTNISLITGIWLPIYIFSLFFISVSLSFKFIQWLLRLNKPIKYDVGAFLEAYPYLSFLTRLLPEFKREKASEIKDYDTNELSVITSVLEKKLVSSWYLPYISQEIGFPFACKQMLDQMISKTFQICGKIETKDVFIDTCTILTSHLNEYRKSLKRQEKSPVDPVERFYKKIHRVSDSAEKYTSSDHCTNLLRIVFKELIPWELWDTPHSELLIRIMAKKLDLYIESTLVDPVWLNDKLLNILKAKTAVEVMEKLKDTQPEPTDMAIPQKSSMSTTNVETALTDIALKTTAPVLQRAVNEEVIMPQPMQSVVEEPVPVTEPVEIKSSPILRQRRGRQGRNEVKIYDRIIEGSVKTWETDIDLQCISLGQDLLASLDGEIALSRLWGQEPDLEGSPNPPRSKSPQPLWFGEEEHIDLDLQESSPPCEGRKQHSPRASETLLKDLQTTVSQAKTKIGDLQVRNMPVDVQRKNNTDEAAGMMEGLLDFGIAGLRKGLRFTGLSDDSQDKSPSHQARSEDKSPSEVRRNISEHRDAGPLLQKEDISNNSAPPLLKQQRVISQDSVPSQPRPIPRQEFPSSVPTSGDSPEPVYEEAADLSTSIAKLRCLLQQRAQAPTRAEDIWWESAEETRGRTQHHHSSKPVDTATLADEYNMGMDRNSSPGQSSNNMQRLDKLFQRTVTGVFNSIKTAVGAEGEETPASTSGANHDWVYVCTSQELSVSTAVARLVGSRRVFSHVDAALDSLDQLQHPPMRMEEEAPPEDFEEWCARRGCAWSGMGAVANAMGLAQTHVAHRIAALLFADLTETLIEAWLDDLAKWLRRQVFATFETMAEKAEGELVSTPSHSTLVEMDIETTCAVVMERMPMLMLAFGEETLSKAVKLSLSSFTHKGVNRDVVFRALDLLTLHFKKASSLRNPSFDAN